MYFATGATRIKPGVVTTLPVSCCTLPEYMSVDKTRAFTVLIPQIRLSSRIHSFVLVGKAASTTIPFEYISPFS